MKIPHLFKRLLGAFAFLAFAIATPAATYVVSSIADLQARINAAVAGDIIIVQNGTYTTSAAISINRAGAVGNPIVITTESIGGVTITGTHGFSFTSPASYIEIEGFVFTHANSINISSSIHHIRLTRNVIQLSIAAGTDVSYVNISGNDVEIDRNELRNKSTLGNMLDVTGSGSQVARRLWVHHNYFHDFTNAGGNGAETIRLGLSGLSMSTGDAIVEHNLFVRCNGENELISNKSSGNIYRYNTFLDSPGAQLTMRHGNDCVAYGNYFRNTDGLRVYGDRHQIFSNYFEGNTKGVDMGNGDGEVADGAPLTCHDRPDDCVVTFNTFVNNNVHYQMGGRTGGLGATNITFANNLIQGGGTAVSISSTAPYANPIWSNNLIWNPTSIGNIPASGYFVANPLLGTDSNGVFRLQSGSPAIDTAVGIYSAVTVDMDGQSRPSAKDIGADEISADPIAGKLLAVSDVGPNSGTTPTAPPSTPAGLAATAGNNRVDLTWNPASGATSYNVKRSTSSGGAYATIASPSGSSYSDATANNGTTYYYVVSGVNSLGESANSSQVSATPFNDSPPAPWQTQDIGAVAAAGSASYNNGTFTIKGSGADIWGTADEFRYVYQAATGDMEVIARVATLQNTNAWAKAGVMIRESVAANSAFVGVYVTPSNGISMQYRGANGAGATDLARTAGPVAPYWVRLVRTGDTFTGYHSANGSSWTQFGSVAVTMTSAVQAGLPVTSHADGTLCTATFDNVSVAGMTPTPDTQAPTAPSNLTSPSKTDTSVNLSWTASIDNVGVTAYDIYNGALLAGTTASTSFTVSGLTASTTYTFTVKARDAAGNVSAASNAVTVTTNGAAADTQAPTAPTNLSSPTKTSTSVTLAWTASTDNVGVTGYDVYQNGVLAGSSASTTFTATGLAPFTQYSFFVKARDAAGNVSAASTTIKVKTNR